MLGTFKHVSASHNKSFSLIDLSYWKLNFLTPKTSWTSQRKAWKCGKLPHDTRRGFLRMQAPTYARASVNTPSLFMCEHSVRARSAGPAVRARTRQCECTLIHIRTQVKTRQSQSYKFKKIAKNSNFAILPETLHATHLLKLLDKMYEYEKDPIRTVGATEWTRECETDGRTDGRSETNIPPNNFVVWGV